MDVVSILGLVVTAAIGGGGIGHKLTDWARERDAREHASEQEDDKTGAPGIEQVLPQALVNQAVPGEDHCSVPPLADVLGAGRAPSQGSWKGPAHGCQLGLRLPFHVVPVRQRKLDNGAPLASVTRPGASDEKLGNLLNHTSRFCPVKNFLLPTGGDSVNPR